MFRSRAKETHRNTLIIPVLHNCAMLNQEASSLDILDGVKGSISIVIGDVHIASCGDGCEMIIATNGPTNLSR